MYVGAVPQRSTALPVGIETSERRNGVASASLVKRGPVKHSAIFAFNVTMNYNYGGVVTTGAQNALTE